MDEVFESESEAGSGKCDTSGLIIDNTTAGNRFDGNYQLRCGGIKPLAVCASINRGYFSTPVLRPIAQSKYSTCQNNLQNFNTIHVCAHHFLAIQNLCVLCARIYLKLWLADGSSKSAARADKGRRVPWPPLASSCIHTAPLSTTELQSRHLTHWLTPRPQSVLNS